MRAIRLLPILLAILSLAACQGGHNSGDDRGSSTPIDSTNLRGTAPAVYGADDPANDADTNYVNANDTGTKLSTGPDRTR